MNKPKIILACDLPVFGVLELRLFKKLNAWVDCYKIGPSFLINEGMRVLKHLPKEIFLDLKLHDIPNTVVNTVKSAKNLGVKYITVHCDQHSDTLRQAAEIKGIQVIGVTSLTSDSEQRVDFLVERGYNAGIRHFVMSGHEVADIKQKYPDIMTIVPGIRTDHNCQDQKRVMSPTVATQQGADFLVLGRTVLNATDPVKALRDIVESLGSSEE